MVPFDTLRDTQRVDPRETMNNSHESMDFAFALPLRWPAAIVDRNDYERELVNYAKCLTQFMRASEGEQMKLLLPVVLPFVSDLRLLWNQDNMPNEIRELLAAVHDVENGDE